MNERLRSSIYFGVGAFIAAAVVVFILTSRDLESQRPHQFFLMLQMGAVSGICAVLACQVLHNYLQHARLNRSWPILPGLSVVIVSCMLLSVIAYFSTCIELSHCNVFDLGNFLMVTVAFLIFSGVVTAPVGILVAFIYLRS